jgi:hypothetical protein
MSGWPNVKRSTAIRFNLVAAGGCFLSVILYAFLALTGAFGPEDHPSWLWPVMVGGLGVLQLLSVWAMRRDQAREDRLLLRQGEDPRSPLT